MKFRILGLAALAAVATALAPHAQASTTPDGGLLITQVSANKWQVRLIAGNNPQRFAGRIETSGKINSIYPVRLESDDIANLASPQRLEIRFDAVPKSLDGVDLWAPATSPLCLRDTGGTGTKVYLGATLATAVAVTAPVSLQGTNACGSSTSVASYKTSRKYNPGHYTALLRSQGGLQFMNDAVRPGVVGIMKRYTWRSLEPTQGNYDFSQVQADLNWANSYGMQLIVMIEDKTFVPERPTPAYLDSKTLRNRPGGFTVMRWDPFVVNRWKALVQAMSRFDSHPRFEGIAMQETALGFDSTVLNANGYSPEKYRDAYLDMIGSSLNSLPSSRVFWFQNFFVGNQSYIGTIAQAMGPRGMVLGGPDVLPDSTPLVTRSYPFYTQFKGQMHMFGQVEGICYNALHKTSGYPTKYWTMNELFQYARDQLHVNYMIWVRIPKPNPSDAYTWFDALPVMQKNPTFN
jgi:hypothetical protein